MDFIPLTSSRKSRQNSARKPNSNFIRDRNLLQRVRGYLQTEGNEMVDIEKMADHLQHQYKDYGRKKKNPFRLEVEKVFEVIVNESKRTNRGGDVPSPDFSSDNENYVEVEDNNMINMSLRKLYASKPNRNTSVREENEVQLVEDGNKKRKRRKIETPTEHKPKQLKKSDDVSVKQSTVKFADMAGCDSTINFVNDLIVHLKYPEYHSEFGMKPPRGILLYGPPGCGKTMLANAIAGELDIPIIQIASTELVAGISGESEERIRNIFDQAVSVAPCVLFIDEIDSVIRKRESAEKGMEVRVVTQLATCMDALKSQDAKSQVLVLATANYPDSIDGSLRRGGRFDHEVNVPIPNEAARTRLLTLLCQPLKLDPDVDYAKLAKLTPGFVGADLELLVQTAGRSTMLRVKKCDAEGDSETSEAERVKAIMMLSSEERGRLCAVKFCDFQTALGSVVPSLTREGFSTVPDVTWDDIGALKEVQEELRLCFTAPLHHGDTCRELGIVNAAGILLFGPPGCGKTLLAKAIANESGLNFISVKGPELLNMYVGESERAIRMCFHRARNASPCVIFFDEFDALCPERSGGTNHESSARLVTQLLTEMDGFGQRESVFIIAATNRPNNIDRAVLRPNRLGKLLYVGVPTPQARVDILKTITKDGTRPPLADDIDLTAIGLDARCDGFTGADLKALVQEAAKYVLSRVIRSGSEGGAIKLVGKNDFDVAFGKVRRSVSTKDEKMYDRMRTSLEISIN